MAESLFTTFLGVDVTLRAFLNRSGNSAAARELCRALGQLRRAAAAQALAQAAATPDPKADFSKLVEIAAAAGLPWQDMAAIVNRAHERIPGA